MIRRLFDFLPVFLAFCCAMRMWQYYVGVRLVIYDIVLLVFTLAFGLRVLVRGRMPAPPRLLFLPLTLLWIILILSASTLGLIDFSLPGALAQFAKGLGDLCLHVAGFTALVLYLTESSAETSRRLLRVYLLGAAASSLYSVFEVACAHYGFDLGKAVFGSISIYGPDFDWSAPFYFQWDVFFRAVGFTGVNAEATYTASAIPLLLLARPFKTRRVNLMLAAICLAGTALTFSRNGLFSLVVAGIVYACLRPARTLRLLPRLVAIGLPLLVLTFLFSATATEMLSTRLYHSLEEVGRGRREIYESTWDAFLAHPFGQGLNQFYVVVTNTDQIDLSRIEELYFQWDDEHVRQAYANLHNNWLTWLFEGGWPLLLAYLAFYASILLACGRSRNALGVAAICSSCGLLASGFFNNTLDLFSTELFFILLAATAVLEKSAPHAAPAVTGTPPAC